MLQSNVWFSHSFSKKITVLHFKQSVVIEYWDQVKIATVKICVCKKQININQGYEKICFILNENIHLFNSWTFVEPTYNIKHIVIHVKSGGNTLACIQSYKG